MNKPTFLSDPVFQRDGANGERVLRWLTDLRMTMHRHGWVLAKAVSESSCFGPGDASAILAKLEVDGLITREKKETNYAPEIRFFGVGGVANVDAPSCREPVLFGWSPGPKLADAFRG